MDDSKNMIKAEGSPDLIALDYLGMTVLVDHEQRTVFHLSEPTLSLDLVIKYLGDEGFLVPNPNNGSKGKEESI
jgi:hypothetical protein